MQADLIKYEKAIGDLFTYLNKHAGMPMDVLVKLSNSFTVRQFPKKSIILQPGEVDHYFNFIASGAVRKYITTGKKEFTLQLSTEGHFIHAELSFFTQMPADCYIEAIEPTVFFSITYNDLEKKYEELPELNRMGRLMIGDMFLKKEKRDMSYMRQSPRERFLSFVEHHPDILQRVPQKYIASYLHIKPETFSRLKHLIRQKSS